MEVTVMGYYKPVISAGRGTSWELAAVLSSQPRNLPETHHSDKKKTVTCWAIGTGALPSYHRGYLWLSDAVAVVFTLEGLEALLLLAGQDWSSAWPSEPT